MILTDGIHVVSTRDLIELHEFAASMGLRRHWFDARPDHPHYDLTTAPKGSPRQQAMQERAVAAGADLVTGRELVCLAFWSRFRG